MSEKVLIERINSMIDQAIVHGGDAGGAYFSNREGLINSMKYFLAWSGLGKDYGIIDEDGFLKFYKKSNIVE